MSAVISPAARAITRHAAWAEGLASALGTTDPLASLNTEHLTRTVLTLRASRHPGARMYAIVVGAELARREAALDFEAQAVPDMDELHWLLRSGEWAERAATRAGFPTLRAAEDAAIRTGRNDILDLLRPERMVAAA